MPLKRDPKSPSPWQNVISPRLTLPRALERRQARRACIGVLLWVTVACSSARHTSPEDHAKDGPQDSAGEMSKGSGPGSEVGSESGTNAPADKKNNPNDNQNENPEVLDPGTVVLHRLNRSEYNATIRDLFGAPIPVADDFPADDPSLGFDNIAKILSISPLQLELYERAAKQVVQKVTEIPMETSKRWMVPAESMVASAGAACCGGFWNLNTNGTLSKTLDLPLAGNYELKIRGYGQQAGKDLPRMRVLVDGKEVATYDVKATENNVGTWTIPVSLASKAKSEGKSESKHSFKFTVEFVNDYWDPATKADRNLLIGWIEVQGPINAKKAANPLREKLVTCDPATTGERECWQQSLRGIAPRVFRRPLKAEEWKQLEGIYDRVRSLGGNFEDALATALQSLLLSPHFLFRVEIDPHPEDPTPHPLGAYELASRLSYFIWSSMPDEELFARAADQSLLREDVLEAQVDRMLKDPKAQALVQNFAGQWLSIRALDDVFKDIKTYPDFNNSLKKAMKKERELFFARFLQENRSLKELLLADWSYVNAELARFYQLPAPAGDPNQFHEVSLASSSRRGLFGQSGLMAVLGHPETTAPVLRGKWVLEQLLCIEPPPPPSDIDISPVKPGGELSMREKLKQHRADPKCVACHELMDPIGLALEHFDGVGKWRDQEAGRPIDASGHIPGGKSIFGAVQLAQAIAQDRKFAHCSVEKAMIYALGRGIRGSDSQFVNAIQDAFVADDLRLHTLIKEIVKSRPFRERRGDK